MKVLLYQLRWSLAFGLLLVFVASCNEDYTNLLKDKYSEPELTKTNKKVLYIIMDGVNGSALGELQPTHIMGMTQNALYSFDALLDLEDYPTDNLLGWSNLLIGKRPSEHGAIGGGTVPDLEANPTILSLAKRSSLVASSQLFYDTFAAEATSALKEASDQEVYEAALTLVGSSDADLVMVEFNGAELAGEAGGYALSNGGYEQAIITLDSYVGALKEAVVERTTYGNEDWLIVVTSNKGDVSPANPSNNHFLNTAKNIFALYYSPKIAQRVYIAPDDFNFIGEGAHFTYTGSNQTLLTLNSDSKFSVDLSAVGKGTTYQFKVKMSGNATSSSWPTLISKNPVSGSSTGSTFDVLSSSGSGAIQVKTGGGNTANIVSPFGDGTWHTVTLVWERISSSEIRVRTYQDGSVGGTVTFSNSSQRIGDTFPLRIGRNNATVNGTPVAVFYDLKVYDVPLPQNYIMNNYCETVVDENSEYYDNLKGYWLLNDIRDSQIPNLRNPNDNSEKFTAANVGPVPINEFVEVFCPPFVEESFRVVPNAVDNPFMVGNWLRMDSFSLRKMDGRVWPFLYITNED